MNLLCVSAILRENPSLHLSLSPVLHETVKMPALGLPLCHPCCQTGKEEGKRLVQAHQGQIFISFGGGTDISEDRDTGFVIRPEITDQASAITDHVQPHQVRIILIFAECGKDISYILSGNSCNTVQIWGRDICCGKSIQKMER